MIKSDCDSGNVRPIAIEISSDELGTLEHAEGIASQAMTGRAVLHSSQDCDEPPCVLIPKKSNDTMLTAYDESSLILSDGQSDEIMQMGRHMDCVDGASGIPEQECLKVLHDTCSYAHTGVKCSWKCSLCRGCFQENLGNESLSDGEERNSQDHTYDILFYHRDMVESAVKSGFLIVAIDIFMYILMIELYDYAHKY